jgi:hypothetical protein
MVMRFNFHRPSALAGDDLGTKTGIRLVSSSHDLLRLARDWTLHNSTVTSSPSLFAATWLNDLKDSASFIAASQLLYENGVNMPVLLGSELISKIQTFRTAYAVAMSTRNNRVNSSDLMRWQLYNRDTVPLTGSVGLMLAINICETVDAYGFGTLIDELRYIDQDVLAGTIDREGNVSHIYIASAMGAGGHDLITEKNFLSYLRDKLHIRFQ